MKKWDVLMLGALVLISAVLFLIFRINKPDGGSVIVRVGKEVQAEYSLFETKTVEIEGKNGGKNTLVIEKGTAYLISATCPDKLCVNQGEIHKQGESIICLPNEVIIEIHEEKENEEELFDAVVQ